MIVCLAVLLREKKERKLDIRPCTFMVQDMKLWVVAALLSWPLAVAWCVGVLRSLTFAHLSGFSGEWSDHPQLEPLQV